MKKISLVNLLLCILFSHPLKAEKVDTAFAKTIATNFYLSTIDQSKPDFKKTNIELVYEGTEILNNSTDVQTYYVFNIINPEGFIVISADDNVIPVLAYSTKGSYSDENQAPAFTDWMKNYSEQIKYVIENKIKAKQEIKNKWEEYSLSDKSLKSIQEVEPLLTTTWNQGCFYNDSCPEDPAGPCGKVFAGCVAIAQAQIMKYWQYPRQGTGSHSYSDSTYGILSADFGSTIYNWDNMPNILPGSNPDISQLLYHVGVSVNMHYSAIGSGAPGNDPLSSLVNYFNYSSIQMDLVSKDHYSADEWSNLLTNELISNRPIYYVGWGETYGHAFVCDGFQNPDYFHFNWGWGGSLDGYFYLNDLSPGGYNFNLHNYCIIGIKPQTTPISVLNPNGNELWEPDSIVSIYWEDTIAENVSIELYKNETYYSTIAESTPSDGEFDWIIPNEIQDDFNYKLKITSSINEEFFDYSNNSFSINKVPYVLSPNGGENWKTFETKTIKWNDIGKDVKIELDTAHLTSYGFAYEYYSTITDSATNGSYEWDIPWDHEPGEYKIKISDNYNNMAYDYGDYLFSIVKNGYGYWLYTIPEELSFDSKEGISKNFDIRGLVGWQITEFPNWIDVSDTSGVGDHTITLTTNSKNETGSDRYDTLYVICQNPCTLPTVKVALSQDFDVSAINDKLINDRIAIYPNPVMDNVIINIDDNSIEISSIKIVDYLGKSIEVPYNKNGNKYLCSLKSLPAGLILLQINTNQGVIIKKIVKQ